MKRVLLIDCLFEGGRMFVGAFSTIYLLARGLTLADVATLKSLQMIATSLLESPTGVIADVIGHRQSLLVAASFGVAGFALYWLGSSFPVFLAAELCVAACLSFWSGAYEAFAIDELRLGSDHRMMDVFFHNNSMVNSFATVLSGLLGAVIFAYAPSAAYVPSILFYMILILLLICSPSRLAKPGPSPVISFASRARAVVKDLSVNYELLRARADAFPTFLFLIAVFAAFQPLLYYWQVFFKDVAGVHESSLGIIFGLMNLAVMLGSALAARIKRRSLDTRLFLLVNMCCLPVTLALFSLSTSPIATVVAFCAVEVFFVLLTTQLKSDLNKHLSSASRASFLSFVGLSSKLLGMVTLALSSVYLRAHEGSGSLPHLLVATAIVIAAVAIAYRFTCSRKEAPERRPIPRTEFPAQR